MSGDRFWGPCQEGTHLLHVGVELLGVPDVLLLGLAQAVPDGVENLLVEQGQLWGDSAGTSCGDSQRGRAPCIPQDQQISSSQLPELHARPCPSLHPALPAHTGSPRGASPGAEPCPQAPAALPPPPAPPRDTAAGPHSYLFLGEPVGQIHLGREEKQRGFPSRAWFEEEIVAGQGRAARTGWLHPQHVRVGCPKGCCDTPQTPHSQGTTSPITH